MRIRSSKVCIVTGIGLVFLGASCSGTQQTAHSFQVVPVEQKEYPAQSQETSQVQYRDQVQYQDQTQMQDQVQEINSKVDLLWVVDNSASMEVSQEKLRQAFASFAKKYMKPDWDIRTAVITSDAYLADPAYSGYWSSTHTDSAGVAHRESEIHPKWGPDYAKLAPGIHDGPVPAMCERSLMPNFWLGPSKCEIREQSSDRGPDACLSATDPTTQIQQCVNTATNDSIHSGQPILATIPPAGKPAADWQSELIRDFLINVSVGTSGSASERGLQSLLQLISDNEAPSSQTKFFRPGTLRVIVFLSDEDDQSIAIPSPVPGKFYSDYGYSANCPSKTVDGFTYRLSDCVDPIMLMPVDQVKARLDSFFSGLDGGSAKPNYLVVSIVSSTGDTIRTLQNLQKAEQKASGLRQTTDQDLGQRYIDLANEVANGSMVIDIGAKDYGPVLDKIGRSITVQVPVHVKVPVDVKVPVTVRVKSVKTQSTFVLGHDPDPNFQPIVTLVRANGGAEEVPPEDYKIDGRTVTLTDDFLKTLDPSDELRIRYEPKGAY